MNELDMLREQINAKTDESLQSTHNMVRMCAESEEVGARTLTQLNEQGEQLGEIDRKLDNMHANLTAAQQDLNELEKCCGLCVPFWKKKHVKNYNYPNGKQQPGSAKQQTVVTCQPGGYTYNNNYSGASNGDFITRITNDAREDEMNQNLCQVSNMIGNLNNMAVDMGNQLNQQNQLIDRIDTKVQSNRNQLSDAQRHADAILGAPSKPQSMAPSGAKWAVATTLMK